MKRTSPLTFAFLNGWSKDQLIDYILKNEPFPVNRKEKRQKASQREINIEEYPLGKVAFRVFYRGEGYRGLATQQSFKSESELDSDAECITIEDCLLKAFQELRLIKDRVSCDFSRCGRTDAGVSAVFQIVALKVRLSSQKLSSQEDQTDGRFSTIDFVKILNKRLPRDIRILGWQRVADDFNARFSCRWRQYHYFFPTENLDLEKMAEAASILVGTHDFHNLSIKDDSKLPCHSTIRSVYEAEISRTNDGFAFLRIKANGFLYHQIRCIMSVLFEIGRSSHGPEYVSDLLDRSIVKQRPGIRLADPFPLVFSRAEFDPPLNFDVASATDIMRELIEKKFIDLFLTRLAVNK